MTYETLDTIADSYVPALLVLAVLSSIPTEGTERLVRFALRVSTLTALAALVYGLMYADERLGLWPQFGLDYSTHTALSVSLVLWLTARWRVALAVWWGSLVLYMGLMLYQRYHTLADIVSTAALIGPIAWFIVFRSAGTLDSPKQTRTDP